MAIKYRPIRVNSVHLGILTRLSSCWVGIHYSSFDRRFCINLIPCFTLWIALPGGHLPPQTTGATPMRKALYITIAAVLIMYAVHELYVVAYVLRLL